jgi:hypothetical protein
LVSVSTYLFLFAFFTDLFVLGENAKVGNLWKLLGYPFLNPTLSLFSSRITPLKFPNFYKKLTKFTKVLKFL